jgi:hypothetical protein
LASHADAPVGWRPLITAGPPLHDNDREDECFHVLDGDLSIH